MNMENKHSLGNKVSFLKYLLTCAIGFGIGGAIWGGWVLYQDTSIKYPLTALGAIVLGVAGSLSFSIFAQNIKQGLKIFFLSFIGTVLGFLIAGIMIYPLFLWGTSLLIIPDIFNDFIKIGSYLKVGAYWLNFFVAGAFIGLFFSFALKTKIWPMVWRGAVGFGLAAIISPIVGNIIGNALNSLFVSYLVTFTLISAVLGVFLGQGAYKNLKP